MCLTALYQAGSGRCKAAVAEKDITCYKIVFPANRDGKFLAQFRPFRYEIGKTYTERKFRKEPESRYIYEGFHSFRIQEAAKFHSFGNLVMLKCIIPKGARYFIGCCDTPDQYCSDKIKVVAWKTVGSHKWRDTTDKK